MVNMNFSVHVSDDGKCPFLEWERTLPVKDKLKLDETIAKIAEHGLATALKMQWVKKLDSDIWEIRSRQGGNIQRACFFRKVGSHYIITHGFTKKTDKTPRAEIKKAHAILNQYR